MAVKKKDDAPELVRVRLRHRSAGLVAGDLLMVSPEEAERLAANGHAFPFSVEFEEKELEAAILSAPDFTDD